MGVVPPESKTVSEPRFRYLHAAAFLAVTAGSVSSTKTAAPPLPLLSVQGAVRIKLCAERKAGELLSGMEKNKGAATVTRYRDGTTLADIGISKNQSSRWQKAATVSDEDFATYMHQRLTNAADTTRGHMTFRLLWELP